MSNTDAFWLEDWARPNPKVSVFDVIGMRMESYTLQFEVKYSCALSLANSIHDQSCLCCCIRRQVMQRSVLQG